MGRPPPGLSLHPVRQGCRGHLPTLRGLKQQTRLARNSPLVYTGQSTTLFFPVGHSGPEACRMG